MPLPDESVTLAVSNYAFHHLDDAGKELALSEVRRVLAPGGRLVVCDMRLLEHEAGVAFGRRAGAPARSFTRLAQLDAC